MSALIEGYTYDIFISYRQKDNKHDGWVTAFVENLRGELESTFKEDVNVYFDVNPHDGLLETHDVDASLKEKLKCLVFIPIISRTYCDPRSFAWEHELMAFVKEASQDRFGLKVRLPNGNVASRILPVRIHDLEQKDITQCETVIGGHLRGVEFIYKEPGVNKPLSPVDDENRNLNKTRYRIQINKTANAVKEIISGILTGSTPVHEMENAGHLPWEKIIKERQIARPKIISPKLRKAIPGLISILIIVLLIAIYVLPDLFRPDVMKRLTNSEDGISLAIMPFENRTKDPAWDYTQTGLISNLSNAFFGSGEVEVRMENSINSLIQNEGVEKSSVNASIAGLVSKKLNADIYITGTVIQSGDDVRISAEMIETKHRNVLKTFEVHGSVNSVFNTIDSLKKKVTDFMIISNMIRKNRYYQHLFTPPKSVEALRAYENAYKESTPQEMVKWFKKALALDSTFYLAALELEHFSPDSGAYWLTKNYNDRHKMPEGYRLNAEWAYAFSFGSYEEQASILKSLIELDSQEPTNHYLLGMTYCIEGEFDKAVTELEIYHKIIRKWGDEYMKEPAGYKWLGYAYNSSKQFKKEEKLYRLAERRTGSHFWINLSRANMAFTTGDSAVMNKQIEEAYNKLKRESKTDADIYYIFGHIFSQVRNKTKAIEFYHKALEADPQNPDRMIALADAMVEFNHNLHEVRPLLDKAHSIDPSKDNLQLQGWYYYKLGNYPEALRLLQQVYDNSPYKYHRMKMQLEEVKKALAGKTASN